MGQMGTCPPGTCACSTSICRAPSIPIFPIFLSVPIIFLYFDEIPIFSYIIFTPKKCRDARMSRHSSCAKMHTWFNRIDVTEQANIKN